MKNVFHFILMLLPLWSSAQIGNVGINTMSPLAMLHVQDSSVLFSGAFDVNNNPGPPPISGNGVRMMWYPEKAAFRTGRAQQDSWDKNNIGKYSFAAGQAIIASGLSSMALGQFTKAEGIVSFAAGEGAYAQGHYSYALGLNAWAAGNFSYAIGADTRASAESTFAIGSGANASAVHAQAIGSYATASGAYANSLGAVSLAKGDHSNAIGYLTHAKGTFSTAMGYGTQSNAKGSIAMGSFNDTIISVQEIINDNTPLFILGNGQANTSRSNALVVNYGGHVGIGTNFPAHKLDVNVNTPDAQISRFSSGGGFGEIIVQNNTNTIDLGITQDWGYVGTKTQSDFRIRTGTFTRMVFQNTTGNVGIATTTPTSTLDVNGTACKPGGGSWIATSDARLKHNVTDYTDGLSSLLQIRPVSYQYNATSGYDTNKQHIGIIAQELQQVAPYMVSVSGKAAADGTTNYLQVDNSAMVYMLINAVKEQQEMIHQLEARIVQLEKK